MPKSTKTSKLVSSYAMSSALPPGAASGQKTPISKGSVQADIPARPQAASSAAAIATPRHGAMRERRGWAPALPNQPDPLGLGVKESGEDEEEGGKRGGRRDEG